MNTLDFALAVAIARQLPSDVLRALADDRLVEELETSTAKPEWKDLPIDQVIQ